MSKSEASVRDQLGQNPDITPFVIPDYDEIVRTYDGTVKIEKNTLGNSWIVASSTNGIVGTNTNTQNGLQQVVGASNRLRTTEMVINKDDTYQEFFQSTLFKDTTNTTGGWDSTVGTALIYPGEILQSLTVYKDTGTAVSATMSVTFGTVGSAGVVTEQMVARGTAQPWETVTDGSLYSFATAGQDLRWKITAIGTAEIVKVKIEYNV